MKKTIAKKKKIKTQARKNQHTYLRKINNVCVFIREERSWKEKIEGICENDLPLHETQQ